MTQVTLTDAQKAAIIKDGEKAAAKFKARSFRKLAEAVGVKFDRKYQSRIGKRGGRYYWSAIPEHAKLCQAVHRFLGQSPNFMVGDREGSYRFVSDEVIAAAKKRESDYRKNMEKIAAAKQANPLPEGWSWEYAEAKFSNGTARISLLLTLNDPSTVAAVAAKARIIHAVVA